MAEWHSKSPDAPVVAHAAKEGKVRAMALLQIDRYGQAVSEGGWTEITKETGGGEKRHSVLSSTSAEPSPAVKAS